MPRVKKKSLPIVGLGIDIVSLCRIRKFFSLHHDEITKRFLNSSEKKTPLTAAKFAELFAAKEAFFKACNEDLMGLDGFRAMRITEREGDNFKIEWRNKGKRKNIYKGEGCFFRCGDLVGSRVIIWRKNALAAA